MERFFYDTTYADSLFSEHYYVKWYNPIIRQYAAGVNVLGKARGSEGCLNR